MGGLVLDQNRVSFPMRLRADALSAYLGSLKADLRSGLCSPGGVLENAEGLSEPSGSHMLSKDATDGSFRSRSMAGVMGLLVLALADLQLDVLLSLVLEEMDWNARELIEFVAWALVERVETVASCCPGAGRAKIPDNRRSGVSLTAIESLMLEVAFE
jgi:hypothetical protein